MIYKTAPFSMTFSMAPTPVSRSRHVWCWISQKWYDIHSFNGIL